MAFAPSAAVIGVHDVFGATTATSPSFDVPAGGCWIYAFTAFRPGAATITSVTDTSSGGPLTWTQIVSKASVFAGDGFGYGYSAFCSGAQTAITATFNFGTTPNGPSVGIVVMPGAATSQAGAATSSDSSNVTTRQPTSGTVTTTAAGSWVLGFGHDISSAAVPTGFASTIAGSGDTATDVIAGTTCTVTGASAGEGAWLVHHNAAITGAGTTVVLSTSGMATGSDEWVMMGVEVLAGTGGGGGSTFTGFVPQRMPIGV